MLDGLAWTTGGSENVLRRKEKGPESMLGHGFSGLEGREHTALRSPDGVGAVGVLQLFPLSW